MSFDAIAPHYRWLERITAGSLLQRCRVAHIAELKEARNILLLGEGRGRFLTQLLRINSEAQITCVDASQRMLELTRADLHHRSRPSSSAVTTEDEGRERAVTSASRVRFLHADILDGNWKSESAQYDAVASHFFLDCFQPDQLAHICSRIAANTVAGARWLISDFCVPDRGWQRLRARKILSGLYVCFRRVTRIPAQRLTPPDTHLTAAGFALKQRQHFNHGLLHSDIWVKT